MGESIIPGKRLGLIEMLAVLVAVVAAVGGFLAYAHAESKAIAAQSVAIHAATPAHGGADLQFAKVDARLSHFEKRLSHLEGDSRVTAEILMRIEKKIDALHKRRR
jgi:hypothetical protein